MDAAQIDLYPGASTGGESPVTLLELNRRIQQLLSVPATQNVWVTAELSDVAVRRGHCYMELLQKDDNGQQVAKARGVIWANRYAFIEQQFLMATGQRFATGLKLMVRVSATMHPVFGLSMVITEINPDYTMGDLLRRRREILARLEREGILELNRQLEWPAVPQRIAVISAPGAAGYGDFINQLYHNQWRLRFDTRLFPAVMQGEKAARSIIGQLNVIAMEEEAWDCVVIIRGGGATSDLQGFEDYDLAANIAQFPLPVIVGIGHERDVTLLDYVANMRVKTPTAAAEWLIATGVEALGHLQQLAQRIASVATDRIAGQREQLSYYNGIIPTLPLTVISRTAQRLDRCMMNVAGVAQRRIIPMLGRLDIIGQSLATVSRQRLDKAALHLDNSGKLLEVLSPQSVLNRGYSITRVNGRIVTSATEVAEGATVETTLANGILITQKI